MLAKTTMMRESFKLATCGWIVLDAIAERNEHSYEQFHASVSHNPRSPFWENDGESSHFGSMRDGSTMKNGFSEIALS